MTDLLEPVVYLAEPERTPVSVSSFQPAPAAGSRLLDADARLAASVGRSAAIGATLGFIGFTVFVGSLGWWVGLSPGGALFLGVFTGVWGGLGFGSMAGSVAALNRDERERLAARDTTDTREEGNLDEFRRSAGPGQGAR